MSRRNGSTGDAGSPALVFGKLLARTRESRAISQTALARMVFTDRTLIGKYEKGTSVPSEEFVRRCDEVLGSGDLLWWMWSEINWYPGLIFHPDWFERRAEMDATLTFLYQYENRLVPGLLQTEAYARKLFEQIKSDTKQQVEARVNARLSRQNRFHSPDGPTYVVLLEESILRQVVGGPRVMSEQLGHLLALGALPNIHVQVVPAAYHHVVAPTESMSLIALPGGERWIYSEFLDGGHFTGDPAALERHQRTYDRLRADALSPRESAQLIAEAREGYAHEPARPQRGAVAQEQLQRQQRWRLHRGGPRIHRRSRPRT
ncbi:helix-turn-helix transcriptional regulator [Streptacidiphilus sp. 4-A2]|nr:helix-turn-helix transcriptional regulator [Streptacidiphilus sp. 4-A2]